MPELMACIGQDDPLGLRERLLVVYERPRFIRSLQLQDACEQIPGATLHSFLATRFWTLHRVHHPGHPPSERFTCDLNYSWLHYKWSAGAAALFWENFDERTAEQEAAYRVDQQAAKKAGKWKTRHVRLALPLHNLVQVAAGTTPDNWQYEISEAAIQASVTFSTWMDEVFSKLDMLRATAPGEARTASDGAPAPSPRDELARIMNVTDLAALLHPVDMPLQTLRTMMLAVLESTKKPLMRHSDIPHLRPVLALSLPQAQGLNLATISLKVLQMLGLGIFALSTNAGGTKVAWFTKIPREDWGSPALVPARDALNLPADFPFYSWTRAEILQGRQRGQPEIVYPDLSTDAVKTAIQTVATAWTDRFSAIAA